MNDIKGSVGLYIIGGSPTIEYLDLIKKYNLRNVHFIDFQSKKALNNYYLVADIFILPTREDIWGLVINEAMAAGLPVITTNKCVAGLELIEDGKNGFIIPVDNAIELSKKITILVKSKELREQMGKISLEIIKNFTIEKMVERHLDILKSLMSSNIKG
jgi:glycosyltransferase involved in cell wall biosynthesis